MENNDVIEKLATASLKMCSFTREGKDTRIVKSQQFGIDEYADRLTDNNDAKAIKATAEKLMQAYAGEMTEHECEDSSDSMVSQMKNDVDNMLRNSSNFELADNYEAKFEELF